MKFKCIAALFAAITLLVTTCFATDSCDSCNGLQAFGHRIKSSGRSDEVIGGLIEWCSGFPGSNPKTCLFIINDLVAILDRLDSQHLCKTIGACSPDIEYILTRRRLANIPVHNGNQSCDFCVYTISNFKSLVSSNETEEELKKYVEQTCDYLGDFKDDCITTLDNNLDQLFAFLRDKIQPTQLCKAIHMCTYNARQSVKPLRPVEAIYDDTGDASKLLPSAPEVKSMLPSLGEIINLRPMQFAPEPELQNAMVPLPQCIVCREVLTYLYRYLHNNKTREAIESGLESACSVIFFHSDNKTKRCDEFIGNYTEMIINVVVDDVKPEVACLLMGLCAAGEQKPNVTDGMTIVMESTVIIEEDEDNKPEVSTNLKTNPYECLFCEKVLNYLQKEIKDNRTDANIVIALDGICDRIFKSNSAARSKCEAYVDNYTGILLIYLGDEFDPKSVCQAVHYCPARQTVGPQCEICKVVMGEIYKDLSNNATETEIIDTLDTVCDKLAPKSFESKCERYVNEYTQEIINAVLVSTNPKEACQVLGMCAGVAKNEVKMQVNPQECTLCKQVFTYLNNVIGDNRTVEAIKNALDTTCDFLPGKKQDCLSFLDQYTDYIFKHLIEETNPDTACIQAHLCTEAEREFIGRLQPSSNEASVKNIKDDLCYECQTILHFIQEQLYNQTEEQEVIALLDTELCDKLSKAMDRSMCRVFVKDYTPKLAKLIAQRYFDPALVCNVEMKLCPNDTRLIDSALDQDKKLELDVIRRESQKSCSLCVQVVNRLDNAMSFETAVYSDINIKEMACSDETTMKEQCDYFVRYYGQYFFDHRNDLVNPRKTCEEIDLCPSSGVVQLLGGHKCTYGPWYWCQSYGHANACQASNFCKRKVWNQMKKAAIGN